MNASTLLLPLDRARVRVLHAMGPVAATLASDRERRVALLGALAVVTTLSLALIAPLWVLALGPVVWGVPHIVADVRYLVVRPQFHRARPLAIGVGLWLVVAALGGGLTAALFAAATAAMLVPHARAPRRIAVAAAALGLAFVAWSQHVLVDAAFVHLHNAVALLLWSQWSAGRSKSRGFGTRAVVLVLAAVATALVLTGTVGSHLPPLAGWSTPFRGFRLGALAGSLAPFDPATWGLRLVYLYAFGQSLHYVVWLRLIPEDDRPSETPRTFRASWVAVRQDLGLWILGLAALAAGLYIVATFFDGAAARSAYLRFSSVHGYLELAALAAFLAVSSASHSGRPSGARRE